MFTGATDMKDNKKYEQVYNFIKDYITENGYSPTVREICANCGIKSTATAYQYMNKLNERGLIRKAGNKKRAVSLGKSEEKTVTVPLVGTVAAGQPIFADENYEGFYALPADFFGGDDMFMLTVKGDSMIKIGMLDGDKIVVKKTKHCRQRRHRGRARRRQRHRKALLQARRQVHPSPRKRQHERLRVRRRIRARKGRRPDAQYMKH